MEKLSVMVGKRIRELRKKRGLRQEDMENFGLNYRYYQDIEAGRANLTLGTIEKVASAFGVNSADLFILPMSQSDEVNELLADIDTVIKENDPDKIRKLGLFVRDIL